MLSTTPLSIKFYCFFRSFGRVQELITFCILETNQNSLSLHAKTTPIATSHFRVPSMSLICEGDSMRINRDGSGSASDTQTYNAESLIESANAHAKHYQTLRDQFHNLQTTFRQIAGLGSDFQGHGADALKAFYAAQVNVVDAWLRLIDKKIAYFHGIAGTIEDKNLGSGTQVHVPFLNEDLSMGYARSKEMVREQRNGIAKILSSISDLVPINAFSSHDIDQALDAADKKRAQMVLNVQDLDQSLTNEYRQIADDLPHIQALYGELINATRQGANVQPMHFNVTAYHDSKIYQAQDGMQKETQKYLEIKKQQEQARIMTAEACLPPDVRMHFLNDRINRGITQGLIDTGKDVVYGFIDMARDPLKAAANTVMALWNWRQTSALIAQAIAESYDKDMVHGDAYTRSRWISYAFATLVTSVAGTKGVDKIGKAAKAGKIGKAASKVRRATKTTLAKHTESMNNKLNEWSTPLFPRTQFANGTIPYNVIDARGLRSKLQKLPDRDDSLTNQVDHVTDLIQQASTRKVENSGQETKSSKPNKNDRLVITHPLSQENIKHIQNRHNINILRRQINYLTDAQLKKIINNRLFFNPKWSMEEISKYSEIAYNDLLRQGKTGNLIYKINGEILNLYIHSDGTFGTVYGSHKFTVQEIRNIHN
ncbi:T7SS effector LXG polymorphic toxin [Sporolactobacillus sp. CPB3-1]|uniref:T7SS effector LXG polymorphic toxin n=1 Tax=Sporolactobacillus mangiferae TaxID=2940498 RepID=A0ABT0MES3_9BACL|nr:T7SS effector LXG polymorphic toxin [Sporolactobacillus mangiferae]MCL1632764.1 T7SS effector LXG polymorphic toxin [Sporolactobacillus mangiferae]